MDLFQLPLSQQAFVQMQDVQQKMQLHPPTEGNDKWLYSWGSGIFASAKVYRTLIGHPSVHIIFKWLWKCQCQPKHKVFFWLLIKDRLSTRKLLRRNMQLDSYNRALCNVLVEESVTHLFLDCAFARMCWGIISIDIPLNSEFLELAVELRAQLNTRFFMEATILLCWTIWKARNELIFNGVSLNSVDCQRVLFQELKLLKHRLKEGLQDPFSSWIQSLV